MKRRISGLAIASLTVATACLAGLMACAPAAAPPPVVVADTSKQGPVIPASAQASFIVSFTPSHDLGRAQSLQAAGRHDEAARLVGVTLRNDATLRGLCFDRFTVGGAEIVLNVCAPSRWEDSLVTQARWLEQLGATPGVAYVERNLVVQSESAPAQAS